MPGVIGWIIIGLIILWVIGTGLPNDQQGGGGL